MVRALLAPVQPAAAPPPAGDPGPPGFEPSSNLITPQPWLHHGRAPRRRRRLLVGAGVLLAAAVLVVGLLFAGRALLCSLGPQETGYAHDSRAYNYRFAFPESGWVNDREAQFGLKASFALRRSAPASGLALLVKDYRDRTPRDGDLMDEALRRLREYFKGLEWERRSNGQLAGKRALVIEFQGEVEQVLMNGECCMATHNGYAYWFLTWAPLPDRDRAAEEWDGMRRRLSLLGGREGWTEQPPRTAAATGTRAAYGLRYAEEIWQKERLDGYDPAADLVLLGHEPGEGRLAGKAATVQVLVLPKQPDLKTAQEAARNRLLEQQRQEGYAETTIELLAEKSGLPGRLGDIGATRGYIVRMHVRNTESRERYLVLAVVREPEQVLVIQCQCAWSRRDYWDPEFRALLESFRLARLQ
jgi:hypothetical protein